MPSTRSANYYLPLIRTALDQFERVAIKKWHPKAWFLSRAAPFKKTYADELRCFCRRAGESADFEVEACDAKGRLALPSNLAHGPAEKDFGRPLVLIGRGRKAAGGPGPGRGRATRRLARWHKMGAGHAYNVLGISGFSA